MKFSCMKMGIAQRFPWVKISYMKLCTAQLPMDFSEAKKSCQGRNCDLIFMLENFNFHA